MPSNTDKESLKAIANLRRELEGKDFQIKKLQLENDELKTQLPQQNIDGLTGLLNRRSLQEKFIEITNTKNTATEICLILIDIDHFKMINDQFGHDTGDKFLQEFANLLRETALMADFIGRVGGEEFCVVLQKPSDVAYNLAELIRTQTETNRWEIFDKPITVSLGVAEIKPKQTYEELLTEADRCLYAAKSRGRNSVVTEVSLSTTAKDEGEDLIITDLENRIRVMTERLTQYMIIRSKRIANHYKQEAVRDSMTGVYNRGYLDRLLDREIYKSKQRQLPLTIAMIDIDDFGKINKCYNWTAGDLAIKAVASVIQQQIRANDWVARYGGDEFIVIMPDTKKAKGIGVAERIRKTLEKTQIKANNKTVFQVTASIGVIESIGEECLQTIYELVGTVARQAKGNGKNRVV